MKMRVKAYPLYLFMLFVVVQLFSGCSFADKHVPINGTMDLRDFNFENHIELDGEWHFVWNSNISDQDSAQQHVINMEVPDSWNGYDIQGYEVPGHGAGSYYLTILLPAKLASYAVEFPTAGTAYNLFVNENLVGGVGIYSNNPNLASPSYEPRIFSLGDHSGRLKIRIDVSNYHHRLGGLWESISFGATDKIVHSRESRVAVQLFMVGAIFIMGLYHLGVSSLQTKGQAALYFGIFCLLIGLRTLATGEVFLHQLFPSLAWYLLVKIEYLTFYLGIPVFFMFIGIQFPDEVKKWATQTVIAVSSIFVFIVVFSPVDTLSASLPYFQPVSLLAMMYIIYALGLAFLRGEEGSTMVLVGFMAIVITFINDMLYVSNIIHTGHLISLGLLVFILAQAFLISIRFSKAYAMIDSQRGKLERTNVAYQSEIDNRKSAEEEVLKHKYHLEELVEERTKELQIANEQLEELSRIDALTMIANRRSLDEVLDREWKRMLREKRPLSVILCDIDHFKYYNDTYGHQQGDDCLVQIAAAIKTSVNRPGDLAARYGGEEFCIVLPETVNAGASQIAELIRQNVYDLKIKHKSSPVASVVTMSLGVATIIPDIDGQPILLLEAADRALYQAKGNGRNRVEQNLSS